MPDSVWTDDVAVLWQRPTEFFPTRDQTSAERTNAMIRFTIYATAAIAAFGSLPFGTVAVVGLAIVCALTMVADDDTKTATKTGARTSAGKRRTTCRSPTKDNPFMNRPPTDFGKPVADACEYHDVKEDVQQAFDEGLVREVTDVYHNRASDRQFVTVPVPDGIPDTHAFRTFLFGSMNTG